MTRSLSSTGKSISSASKVGDLALRAMGLAALAAGIIWNARLGIADVLAHRNLPAETRLAMLWMPANGAYAAQQADEEYASDPNSARQLLQKAVNLNRFDAASWIQLGLLAEAGNDLPRAEASLLQGAKADSTFLPSWSLANFYFRQGNAERFWYWAQRATQMVPDDATPLFRLAWYVTPKEEELEQRLRIGRPKIADQLVNFLITQGDASAVTLAALHRLPANDRESVETLLGACDWLIAGQHTNLALTIWNGLAAHRQIPYSAVTDRSLDRVTNGKFDQSPSGRGFDWRLSTVEGISFFWNQRPNALGFEFSGAEPDSFLLLRQAVPVAAKKKYALGVAYDTDGIAPESGIAWSVTDALSGAVLAKTANLSAEQSSEPGGGKAMVCFTVPEGTVFVNLSLGYQRPPGQVRAEGKLVLKEVRLAAADGGACAENSALPWLHSPAL